LANLRVGRSDDRLALGELFIATPFAGEVVEEVRTGLEVEAPAAETSEIGAMVGTTPARPARTPTKQNRLDARMPTSREHRFEVKLKSKPRNEPETGTRESNPRIEPENRT